MSIEKFACTKSYYLESTANLHIVISSMGSCTTICWNRSYTLRETKELSKAHEIILMNYVQSACDMSLIFFCKTKFASIDQMLADTHVSIFVKGYN